MNLNLNLKHQKDVMKLLKNCNVKSFYRSADYTSDLLIENIKKALISEYLVFGFTVCESFESNDVKIQESC
jgi:hypothetical protein